MSDIISPLSGNAAEEPMIESKAEQNPQAEEQPLPAEKEGMGVALVGLGSYATNQIAKALEETAYCRLVGLVSGDEAKLEQWRKRYNLDEKNVYTYDTFDEIVSNRDIDIVYIALPNSLHAEYVIRAARAGKHVICEKPMATNVEDCHRMIEACKMAGVRLSIGYRLHFDPFNQEMMRLGQSRILGSIDQAEAVHCMDVGNKNQWRLNKTLAGGGPLMDLGIYCIQAALYTIGELPVAVEARFHAKTNAEKFRDVEEGLSWEMHFPLGVKAVCETSYSRDVNFLRAETVSGQWFELRPAFLYDGLRGETSEGPMNLVPVNQQAAQLDDFAFCIQNDMPTRVPGEMGLRDVEILMAIYEAAATGSKVDLELHEFKKLIEI
jgi:predicted dehydrogenase